MRDRGRPSCYPPAPVQAISDAAPGGALPSLDVLTSPVPSGRFDSPVDHRHVLCLHLGGPVPVSYRATSAERRGTRLHGQFCVVPAGSSTRWTLSAPATSLLLRLAPERMHEAAATLGLAADAADPAPAIHVRDEQIEHIGWMMQRESHDGYPSGRLFADALACALAARLLRLRSPGVRHDEHARALPAWRLRNVVDYIEAHLDADLTLAELADVAGFSVSHFKVLFRNACGMPAHRFVMQRRVERACEHLANGRMSMTEIALATGFAHPSHMARCIRAVRGVGPTQIAVRHRG
ncbi:AraC family transcriptional regulator [Lysobacter sp. LF1]|uniref:AraC family transcriptional regulator n=1 Tax=Lysobacter stagni TaxID=3045172 RepID=A0ABT6XCI1_9GAMM|nr:AraC family transcriptional regulator [Lysobacter sp. LF1]MDI9237855.1 AraC family transcriptional regulator [Lysobacter sp. LF1]